jgi:CRP-like cAMP-binding protein
MQAENRLLAALPAAEYERWKPHLELTDMPLGQVLAGPGVELAYAYFPVTAIVSLLYVMRDGKPAEIALIGNEGMIGASLVMAGKSATIRAVVRSAGIGYRLPASELKAALAHGGGTLRVLLLHIQSLMTQMTQTAACNRHHNAHQQFCRWLLSISDRLHDKQAVITQEFIASMLGLQADGVTELATRLHAEGAIDYRDGAIKVSNRAALERFSCECYGVVKRECDRLLAPPRRGRRSSRQAP